MIAAALVALSGEAVTDLRPDLDDPVTMAMRPQGRCLAQITVSKTSPGADFTTIHEAVAKAQQVRDSKMAAEAAPRRNWNYRVDVIIDPGDYAEDYITDFDCIALYAADGGHSSVKLRTPTVAFPPSIEPHGFTYCEGISIETVSMTDGSAAPKYPLHLGNIKVFIYARGSLLPHAEGSAGAGFAIGTDGGDNALVVLHDVYLGAGTNQHGWAFPGMRDPMHVIYSRVTALGGVGYGALTDERQDEMWVVNTTAADLNLDGAMTWLHIYNSTIPTIRHQTTSFVQIPNRRDNRSDWPIPYGGYSDYYRTMYGTPPHDGATLTAPYPTTSTP